MTWYQRLRWLQPPGVTVNKVSTMCSNWIMPCYNILIRQKNSNVNTTSWGTTRISLRRGICRGQKQQPFQSRWRGYRIQCTVHSTAKIWGLMPMKHARFFTDGQLEYLQDLVMFAAEMNVPEQKGWDIQTFDNLLDEVMKWMLNNHCSGMQIELWSKSQWQNLDTWD